MIKRKIKIIALLLCLGLSVCVFAACGPSAKEITVTKMPDKVEYKLGEELSLTGGEITAVMADDSVEVIPMTDENVTLSKVNMNKAGKKSITASYGGARVRFTVTVNPIIVTFDLGGKEAAAIEPLELKEKGKIKPRNMPKDPVCDGFDFEAWFLDENLTEEYSENEEITADTTLYAKWLDVSATYYTVTFDRNYYGAPKDTRLTVEENVAVAQPKNPARAGYGFDGWYTEASGGSVYNFATPVTGNMSVYAHWTRTSSGTHEYVFEGEDMDLSEKSGDGYSGAQAGAGMIMIDGTNTASNGMFVGYTYTPGLSFEFRIASDQAASNVKIVARLSAEFKDLTLSPDMFGISVNGEPIKYGTISITGVQNGQVRYFEDFVLTTTASLKEGENTIVMSVDNDFNWIGGGTGGASAPLIDCVKITTDAVLWWDGEYGCPANNY